MYICNVHLIICKSHDLKSYEKFLNVGNMWNNSCDHSILRRNYSSMISAVWQSRVDKRSRSVAARCYLDHGQ